MGDPESLIEIHETVALVTLNLFSVLLLTRVLGRNRLSPPKTIAYLVVTTIGFGALSATGHFGGNLVYRRGAGVRAAIPRLSQSTPHQTNAKLSMGIHAYFTR